jgi:hypothetical protein
VCSVFSQASLRFYFVLCENLYPYIMPVIVATMGKNLALATAMWGITASLQGCGSSSEAGDTTASTSAWSATWTQKSCSERCEQSALVSRWKNKYAFLCEDPESKAVSCRCSPSETEPPEGCSVKKEQASLLAVADSNSTLAVLAAGRVGRSEESHLALNIDGSSALDVAAAFGDATKVSSKVGGSPRETVHNFCDEQGLAEMHGAGASTDLQSADAARELESKILADVSHELETNNVDKMAKDIFSFYVCTVGTRRRVLGVGEVRDGSSDHERGSGPIECGPRGQH